MRLAVLAHHDDRRLDRRERREHKVEKNEGVRVEGMPREQPRIDQHPDHEDGAEQPDERPAAANLRHPVPHALSERHARFVFFLLLGAPATSTLFLYATL